jgi:hypothetical protein
MQAWSAQPIDGTILGVRLPASWRMSAHANEHERLRFGRYLSIAKSMAFWAFYTGAIASASIVSFSIVRDGRDAKPAVAGVQPDTPRGTEAIAVPGSVAIADDMNPRMRVADSDLAAYRETETPQRSNTGQLYAIEQLIEPAASGGFVDKPAAPVARPLSAAPAETAPNSEAGELRSGEKLQIAAKDKAKTTASAPAENVSTAPPSQANAAKRHTENTSRRPAQAKRSVERRPPRSLPRSVYDGPGAGSYYTDATRGYGYGTYGPAPYSDRGD